jgi:hypothetical protein
MRYGDQHGPQLQKGGQRQRRGVADAMNCVQRRVFRAFVRSGGDPNNPAQFAALMRCVQALVLTLPNRAGRVVDLMLRGDERTTYAAVAERLGISEGAARVDGWRGSSLLAEPEKHS